MKYFWYFREETVGPKIWKMNVQIQYKRLFHIISEYIEANVRECKFKYKLFLN